MNKSAFRDALKRSLPILCSYVFIGAAFGITMSEAGYGWPLSALSSAIVYTGAFQFVLAALLAASSPLGTIALTALLMNSRQAFYSLTFIDHRKNKVNSKEFSLRDIADGMVFVCNFFDIFQTVSMLRRNRKIVVCKRSFL